MPPAPTLTPPGLQGKSPIMARQAAIVERHHPISQFSLIRECGCTDMSATGWPIIITKRRRRRVVRKGERPVSPLRQAGNSSSAKVSRAEPSRAKAERLPPRPSRRHIIAESDGLLCGKKKRRRVRAEQCGGKLGLPRLGGTGRSLGGGAPLYHKRRHYRATDFSDNTTFTNNRNLNISLGRSGAR